MIYETVFSFLIPFHGCQFFRADAGKGDTISFCFIKYKIPAGCTASSEYQLKCDDYSMTWIYLTPQSFQTMPDQIINQMAGQVKKFKKGAGHLLSARQSGERI